GEQDEGERRQAQAQDERQAERHELALARPREVERPGPPLLRPRPRNQRLGTVLVGGQAASPRHGVASPLWPKDRARPRSALPLAHPRRSAPFMQCSGPTDAGAGAGEVASRIIRSMVLTDDDLVRLQTTANRIRQDVIKMLVAAGSGHSAGPLGMADVFTTLYFQVLRHDPRRPDWPERDRLVLSNGHICPVLYATLAEAGYFPVAELATLRQIDSHLQGHPNHLE